MQSHARSVTLSRMLKPIREGIEYFANRSPSQFAIVVFAGMILVFSFLFALPMASADGQATNYADALFTAVTTVCVAGLTTVDMATHWSPFGNALIVIASQVGAIGVLTLASILGLVVSGRLGLRARLLAAGDTNPVRMHAGPVSEGQAIRLGDIGGLLVTVAVSLLAIEAVIAVGLFPGVLAAGYDVGTSVWMSIFYSAMAFTNTGITPNVGGILPFAENYAFLGLIMVAVTIGSLGFPVIHAIRTNWRRPRSWPLHVKLTISSWFMLWVVSSALYLLFEFGGSSQFAQMGIGDRIFQAGFMSTMSRSGGFNVVDYSQLDTTTLMLTDILMFIGGGSASTAGGIKVTTLAVLLLAAFAEATGRSSMEVFRKRIPSDVLRLSVSVLLWGVATCAIGTMIVSELFDAPFEFILFDVISGFGTVGLSTGVTAAAPDSAQLVIALIIFMGRVGTVTMAAALARQQVGRLFVRPEERPIVG
jgi:Trk-type K+ transport system membrane component